jgi:Ca-activated chloride channel family protein
MKNYRKSLLLVGCLIAFTCVAIGYAKKHQTGSTPVHPVEAKTGILTLSGHLTQSKVLVGGDPNVALSLTIKADDVLNFDRAGANHVDLVIVLDRSGSMRGQKLEYAKQAVLNLLANLTEKDRFALVTYSDGVKTHSNLIRLTPVNRKRLEAIVNRITAGGATNLGAGLHQGIKVISKAKKNGNMGKVILISDGLANRGITSINSLGNMASIAVEDEFGVSTVGVGEDFNEQLMTTIADRGTGHYHYLENPNSFAKVFQQEFANTRNVVATSLEVRVPVNHGMSLVSAAGYPIKIENNEAVFYPGDMLSGQTKKLFLTLRVPNEATGTFEINGLTIRYKHQGNPYTVTLDEPFQIACVKEQKDVFASIDKVEWEEKVLKDDYNKLRDEVAAEIKKGKKEEALDRIHRYRQAQESVNAVVGSSRVSSNLEQDVHQLEEMVKGTFQGAPAEVELKQKRNAKALQYEGYVGRRMSK